MSTDELERKLEEKGVELIELLDEKEHLRSKHIDLLNKLKQKHVLSRKKVEQDM